MSINTKIPPLVHVLVAGWIVGILTYAVLSPTQYEMLMQEDREVEWATVWLFLFAGGTGLLNAIRRRRAFDGLVALFCLFVAGEEFSWGQRLIGYYPPQFFLENNFQQEANLHNLPQTFVQPKWILMCALAGYGILLPALERWTPTRNLLVRLGATPPPPALVPWFTAAVALLFWYPVTFTGEWIEALSGGLFLTASGPTAFSAAIMTAAALIMAVATTSVSGHLERERDVTRTACADREVRSLLNDVANGTGGTRNLWRMRHVHKRVWSAINEGYVRASELRDFNETTCDDKATTDSIKLRHQFGIDPWGTPYWLEVERKDEDHEVAVYSFGPNRRRDASDAQSPGGDVNADDIRATSTRRTSRK